MPAPHQASAATSPYAAAPYAERGTPNSTEYPELSAVWHPVRGQVTAPRASRRRGRRTRRTPPRRGPRRGAGAAGGWSPGPGAWGGFFVAGSSSATLGEARRLRRRRGRGATTRDETRTIGRARCWTAEASRRARRPRDAGGAEAKRDATRARARPRGDARRASMPRGRPRGPSWRLRYPDMERSKTLGGVHGSSSCQVSAFLLLLDHV